MWWEKQSNLGLLLGKLVSFYMQKAGYISHGNGIAAATTTTTTGEAVSASEISGR